MKLFRWPVISLGLFYLIFFTYVGFSFPQLPERVATHFDVRGQPNGWMDRSSHLVLMVGFGVGLPLLIILSLFLVRFVPGVPLNIPRRDYWVAPERRRQTFDYLFCQSLWLASIAVGFITGLHYLVARANSQAPAQLSSLFLFILVGGFLVALGVWITRMLRHFRHDA